MSRASPGRGFIEGPDDVSSDPALLRADGFRQGISQLISEPSGQSDGVVYVAAFRSSEGALRHRDYLHRYIPGPDGNNGPSSGETYIHFVVPGRVRDHGHDRVIS